MATVSCWADECKWCEHGWCKRDEITISDDWECEDFESYQNDYTDSFWKACSENGVCYRRLCNHGRKIVYNGYLFYTQDKITDSGNYFLTEARTGIGVCNFYELEKRWDKFLERVGDYPDVTTLPIKEARTRNGQIY